MIDEDGVVSPPAKLGENLEGLSPDIEEAYSEARSCLGIGAFTACELLCRKLLMCVAVEEGAAENLKFVQYIEYLKKTGFVTPPIEPWVNAIKDNGNDATHELPYRLEQSRSLSDDGTAATP